MTYTVLAASVRHGLLAAATASRSLAVGSSVISVVPGLGAVASQAYTNPALRREMLGALAGGASPDAALEAMAALDPELEFRQLAVLDAAGRGSARTGAQCTAWAGHLVGDGFVLAGNLLAGDAVLQAMAAAIAGVEDAADAHELGARAVAALAAGEAAGGDRRGRQSAAVAVASIDRADGLVIDLRVDDAAEPVDELERLLTLSAAELRARTA